MSESAEVRACRHALMTAALRGDVELMADLHARLDHLTCLRRLVPTQRTADGNGHPRERDGGVAQAQG